VPALDRRTAVPVERARRHLVIAGTHPEDDLVPVAEEQASIPAPMGGEQDLISRAASGEDEAWRDLFDAYYPRLYRFFRARVASHEQAEDLASQVFMDAFRSIGNFRWQGAPFGGWLFSIARRVLASHYRSKSPELPVEVCEHTRDEYLAIEVRDILDRLPVDYREALELRYVMGLSGEEAAGAMGRTHGAFRALLLRASRAYRAESEEPIAV
jgi:RNA polymerase sigma-70 factor (ECF subfamily)